LKKRDARKSNPEAKIPWQLTSLAQGLFFVNLVNQELQMDTNLIMHTSYNLNIRPPAIQTGIRLYLLSVNIEP
jgi:hypothetical protein